MRTKINWAILMLLFHWGVVAQPHLVTHFDQNRNFLGGVVYDVVEDHNGYWWLATDRGVFKYNFNSFVPVDGTRNLPFRTLIRRDSAIVAYSRDSILMIASKPYDFSSIMKSNTNHVVNTFFLKSEWITVTKDSLRFDNAQKNMKIPFSEKVTNICKLPRGWIILSESGDVYNYDLGDNSIVKLDQNQNNINIKAIIQVNDTTVWLCGKRITALIQGLDAKMKYKVVHEFESPINNGWKGNNFAYFHHENGSVTKSMLQVNQQLAPQLISEENDAPRNSSLRFQKVNKLLESGPLKLIASDRGFHVCKPNVFRNPHPNLPANVAGSMIPMSKDRNELIVGGVLYTYLFGTDYELKEGLSMDNQIFAGTKVGTKVWTGTQTGEVKVWENYLLKKSFDFSDRGEIVFFLHADQDENVWFCQAPGSRILEGVSKITPKGKVRYYNGNDGVKNRVLVLRENAKGEIFCGAIGPDGYLFKFDKAKDRFENLSVPLPFEYSVRFEVHDLAIDEFDRIWLATTDGLLKYEEGIVERINLGEDTRINTEIRSITTEVGGIVWFSTDSEGIFKYENGQMINYDEASGLVSKIGSYRSMGFDSLNNLWVGTYEGFTLATPAALANEVTARPILSGFKECAMNDGTRFVLDPNQPATLEFTATSFPSNALKYKYYLKPDNSSENILNGAKEDWTEGNYESQLKIRSLGPGDYELLVRAQQTEGGFQWSDELKLSIEVPAPWYKKPIAFVIYIIVAILLLLTIMRVNTIWLRRENQKLERLVNKRTDELKQSNAELEKKSEEVLLQAKQTKQRNEELNQTLSQLQTTQQQLIESEKMASIGVLTAGLAHELNNPLSYVGGVVDPLKLDLEELKPLLSEKKKGQSDFLFKEIEQLLNNLQSGVTKASGIIKQLLDISPRVHNPKHQQFNIDETIISTTKLLQTTTSDVVIELNFSDNLPVEGDQVELNQVIVNLLKNAIDSVESMNGDAKVSITGERSEDNVVITVQDNGIGIPESSLHKIFEPFYTTKEPNKGTGLGLYISYTIINKHKGSLTVESSEGQGSTFKITLPTS